MATSARPKQRGSAAAKTRKQSGRRIPKGKGSVKLGRSDVVKVGRFDIVRVGRLDVAKLGTTMTRQAMKPLTELLAMKSKSGRFVVNGVSETQLVNKHPKIAFAESPGKPKHLTPDQITNMVNMMKIE